MNPSWWPFSPSETHGLIRIVFVNRLAFFFYALGALALAFNIAAFFLRGRVGWQFGIFVGLAGLALLFKIYLDLTHGLFDILQVIEFIAGLGLLGYGFEFVKNSPPSSAPKPKSKLPAELPPSTAHGKAREATEEEIDQALRDRPPITPGGRPYRYED